MKPRREKQKCDPKLVAAARELRDRYLEQVNDDVSFLLSAGKYEVARALPDMTATEPRASASGIDRTPGITRRALSAAA